MVSPEVIQAIPTPATVTAEGASHEQTEPAAAAQHQESHRHSRPSSTAAATSEPSNTQTIMLIQMSKHESTRSYWDYPSTTEAIEAALVMYETRLKEQNMGSQVVTYDLQTLFNFVDDLVSHISWQDK